MNTTPLSDIEWTLLYMAVRYAMNRQSIASATLPHDVARHYYWRMDANQRKMMYRDLKENLDRYGMAAFGSPSIDRPTWIKLMNALNEDDHFAVRHKQTGEELRAFNSLGRTYPLMQYIGAPYAEIWLKDEDYELMT